LIVLLKKNRVPIDCVNEQKYAVRAHRLVQSRQFLKLTHNRCHSGQLSVFWFFKKSIRPEGEHVELLQHKDRPIEVSKRAS